MRARKISAEHVLAVVFLCGVVPNDPRFCVLSILAIWCELLPILTTPATAAAKTLCRRCKFRHRYALWLSILTLPVVAVVVFGFVLSMGEVKLRRIRLLIVEFDNTEELTIVRCCF